MDCNTFAVDSQQETTNCSFVQIHLAFRKRVCNSSCNEICKQEAIVIQYEASISVGSVLLDAELLTTFELIRCSKCFR